MQRVLLAVLLCAALHAPAFACGSGKQGSKIPRLASLLDEELPAAGLAETDMAKVKALRQEIAKLAAQKNEKQARIVEAEAMKILGYKKMFLKCGPGTFFWAKASA